MVVVLGVVAARLAALTSRSNDAGLRGHFFAADVGVDASARVIFVGTAAMLCAALAIPFEARAETPLAAFCADNAAELQRTSGEMGLDPAKWASDPRNLARFGFHGAGDIDTLYHMVIDKGAPYITSHWSNENGAIEWRCSGQ